MTRLRLGAALAAIVAATAGQDARGAADVQIEHFRVHAEAWTDYTEKNGEGLAWDILRAVYNPVDIELKRTAVPYARAVKNVLHGRADGWVASYHNEESGALYPKWHFDADRIEALYRPEHAPAWQGKATLRRNPAGWVRGYAIGQYLPVGKPRLLLNDRANAWELLRSGRITYYLDAAYELDHMLATPPEGVDPARYARKRVGRIKLYMAFADTARGRTLRAIWDRRFPKLLDDGTIAAIHERWSSASTDEGFWPFDHPRQETK